MSTTKTKPAPSRTELVQSAKQTFDKFCQAHDEAVAARDALALRIRGLDESVTVEDFRRAESAVAFYALRRSGAYTLYAEAQRG